MFSFHEVKLTNIDGSDFTPETPIFKTLADKIYKFASSVGMVDKAIAINRGEPISLTKEEVEEVRKVVVHPLSGFLTFVQKALLEYIDSTENKK